MGLAFEHPWALLLALAGIAAVWLADRRYRLGSASLKRKASLGARMILCVLMALAIAGPSVLTGSGAAARWVLLDVSDSAKDVRPQEEQMVADALEALPDGQRAGVIAFGGDAMVETPMSENPSFTGVHAAVDTQSTNLDEALRLAAALLPDNGAGGLELVTDGKAEVSQATVDMLAARGVRVDVLTFSQETGADAQVSRLEAPVEAYEGQIVPLRVLADANTDMNATLVLYQNGEPVATREVELKKGENRFAFSVEALKTGVVTYEARLVSARDTQARNNSAAAYVRVSGAPAVLMVSEGGTADALFAAAGMRVETIAPSAMPAAADGYLPYDAVILNNVDYEAASEMQWQALEAAVRSLGRGLLALGGDSSYALGGYRGSVAEGLLPVRIDVRDKQRMPALALIICIDKSGSMTAGQFGSTRIEVAKEAAMSAVEVLNEHDFIGVIGFDDTAKWVVPFQNAADLGAIQSQIGTLRADGGTAFYSALYEAYQTLMESDAPQKHVIFLSDGEPADSSFENVALAMQKGGITLTTVAVGSGADSRLMQLLSTLGGGRSYAVGEFDNIPRIFTKETLMVGGQYVQNRTFTPVITENSELTNFEGFPTVDGYLTTVEKPTAHVALASDTEDPLLAWWNVGAGKAVAWTSDAEGAWTNGFLRWEDAPRFFGGMLAKALPGADRDGALESGVSGETLNVRYTLEEAEGGRAEAEVVLPDGTRQALGLAETAPGQFDGQLDAPSEGAYAIRVTYTQEDGTAHTQEGGAVRGFSQEYDLMQAEGKSLTKLAEQTGGRMLAGAADFWQTPVERATSRQSLRELLCVLTLIWLLMDIALRKLPWEELLGHARPQGQQTQPRRVTKAAKPPKARTAEKQARAQAAQDTTDALLKAKQARRGQ
ncbi:MAG: VWA domain-containing protein [Clostridiales bacterium]|nr:VWA domain-containing protein [Clostridiales bacterium]